MDIKDMTPEQKTEAMSYISDGMTKEEAIAKVTGEEFTAEVEEINVKAVKIMDETPFDHRAIPTEETHLPSLYKADIVRPAISAQAALQAWNEFQSLKTAVLSTSDLHLIQGKSFVKKSGWRKFATFYNLTDKIVDEQKIENTDGTYTWKIKAECIAPNGRITEGVAMCNSKEKSGARQEHDCYTTAHTRAKNRAISDMIAAGEVSAEEMEGQK